MLKVNSTIGRRKKLARKQRKEWAKKQKKRLKKWSCTSFTHCLHQTHPGYQQLRRYNKHKYKISRFSPICFTVFLWNSESDTLIGFVQSSFINRYFGKAHEVLWSFLRKKPRKQKTFFFGKVSKQVKIRETTRIIDRVFWSRILVVFCVLTSLMQPNSFWDTNKQRVSI